jgi:hypothetical protein
LERSTPPTHDGEARSHARPQDPLRAPGRPVAGKDGNPLNEVELIADSLINNDGVLRGNNVIKLVPEQSVLTIGIGDRIRLSAAQFERLSAAFFSELRSRFG